MVSLTFVHAIALWLSAGVLSKADQGPNVADSVKPPVDPTNDDKPEDKKKDDGQLEPDDSDDTTKEVMSLLKLKWNL